MRSSNSKSNSDLYEIFSSPQGTNNSIMRSFQTYEDSRKTPNHSDF